MKTFTTPKKKNRYRTSRRPADFWDAHIFQPSAQTKQIRTILRGRINPKKQDSASTPNYGVSISNQKQPNTVIQRYTRFNPEKQRRRKSLGWKSPSMKPLRVSDFGLIAAEEGIKGSNNRVWAVKWKIRASERVLKGLDSAIKMEPGSHTQLGKAPFRRGGGGRIRLHEVMISDRSGARSGRVKMVEDCGHLSRHVLGLKTIGEKAVAVSRRGSTERYSRGLGYSEKTGVKWAKEIHTRELPRRRPRASATRKYKRFAKRHGIDQYAKPRVGEGMMIAERNIPTFKPAMHYFHMAAVILSSKNDYVTMETIAPKTKTVGRNDNWYFAMYGTVKPLQTFHKEWGRKAFHGKDYTTMVFKPEKRIIGVIRSNNAPLYVGGKIIARLAKGTRIRTLKLGRRWRRILVNSGTHSLKRGWIVNWYFKHV